MGNQLQSVVLYGHRRMGKTSILLNAANCLGSQIQLAYFNLLRLGDSPQGVGEVLMAICDEISQAVKLPSLTDADLLNLPYRTFERYLKQVEAKLDGGLIIALDEFEKIEDLIEAGKIPIDCMGFQLVRGYNNFVFEQGRSRNPVFTIEDVEAVINDPEFFKRGRYYFDGVWGQAVRGAKGQQAIVQVLAPHPEGLSLDALAQSTGMNDADLQEALNTLKRHDVVEETQGSWRIMVELFRRWVLQQ
ncbi:MULTISPECIES: helix-turn-helix domain-containing protein [unclassified Nostoc]|uniref:helix-turn-helix domain-containing protein n=1 Tax=unclassified Nostoc TaxID=2593658 RepID=UPI002AD417EC|nr:helix-turn-helix domain-containing protein [Nostoc sp. DedQUE03]MDZ7972121.1 hypothetical protein [Nostoc sp. DedQUE03]MDZ8043924.1 hypothetical protein [Nostoc sp. DedQUE02]